MAVDLQFSALRCGSITLHRITDENWDAVRSMFGGVPDSDEMIAELEASYQPRYDSNGCQTRFAFYTILDGVLAGGSILGISSWPDRRGYTGADTLAHMRGKGVAPGSKPHLFYLGFELLGMNRIETGHLASNLASMRSIQKTPGLQFEGILRSYGRNADGEFEDEYRYAILRRDWLRLYDGSLVEVIR